MPRQCYRRFLSAALSILQSLCLTTDRSVPRWHARGSAYLFADNVALEELSLVVADKSEDKSVLRLRESARYSHFLRVNYPPSLLKNWGSTETPGRPP